jgi:membrane protease YdiL (CAAX protease family)
VLIAFAPIIVNRMRPALPYGVPTWLSFALYLLTYRWMLVFPLLIARRRLGRWPRLPSPRVLFVQSLKIALSSAVLVLITFMLTSTFLARLFGATEMPPNPIEPIAHSPDRFEVLSFRITAVLVAPVVEEIFFRGMFYNALRQRFHVIVAKQAWAVSITQPVRRRASRPKPVLSRRSAVVCLVRFADAHCLSLRERLFSAWRTFRGAKGDNGCGPE